MKPIALPNARVVAALLATLFVLTAAVPGAVAQGDADNGADLTDEKKRPTSFVTFYGHLFGLTRDNPMPMNTQFPTGEEDISQGLIGTFGTCGHPGNDDCETSGNNEVWFYSTAGFVQFKDASDFDYAQIHNERGLTKDTILDTSQNIRAEFYMSADAHGWPVVACQPGVEPEDVAWPVPCWQWDPGMLNQWVLKATVYTGVLGEYGGLANTAPDMQVAYESGALQVLAEGATQPVDVQSMEAAGQPTVWKFDIDLGPPQREIIPKEESYLVRFQWYSLTTGEPIIIPEVHSWNANGGEDFPPTVTLPVKNAFDVESVIPQFVYGKLVILGILNTPWGSYDVNQDSIAITITNEDGEEVVPQRMERLADFSVAHGGHYKPVNITWVWDYAADGLPPGKYNVKVEAENFQGSADGECTATFTVRDNGRPGSITIGACGVNTLTQQQLREIQEGATQEAGKSDGTPKRAPGLPDLRVASSDVDPVNTLPVLPALAAALAIGLALRRRWNA